MTVRSTTVLALAGIAAVAVAAGFAATPAKALTFENYQGASGGSANGWVDLNYDDPNKKPTRNSNGNKTYQNGNTTLQFGPSGGSSLQVNPNSYFTPNYLMGK
ncbi:MAG: hypothetical protein JSR72_14310 [Proteobacteria bacterium]|nr:hypothetical protein [Pseudomonadota bacterium]